MAMPPYNTPLHVTEIKKFNTQDIKISREQFSTNDESGSSLEDTSLLANAQELLQQKENLFHDVNSIITKFNNKFLQL